MNIKFFYVNEWDNWSVTSSTRQTNFRQDNTQSRWLAQPWRSRYGAESGWGQFYIDTTNNKLYFNEGAATITATISGGSYSAYALADEIETQLLAAGTFIYSVSYSDDTNKFTILSTSLFELEGSMTTNSIFDTIGYYSVDTGLLYLHVGDELRIHSREYVFIAATTGITVSGVFIFNHNVQTSGELKIQFSNDNFSTIEYEYSPARNGTMAVQLIDSAITYNYVRIYIEDGNNPDLFSQIGRVWLGTEFTPQVGYAPGSSLSFRDISKVVSTSTGQKSAIDNGRISGKSYSFDAALPLADFEALFESRGTSRELVIVEKSLLSLELFATPELYTKYVHMKSMSTRHVAGDIYSANIKTEQEK